MAHAPRIIILFYFYVSFVYNSFNPARIRHLLLNYADFYCTSPIKLEMLVRTEITLVRLWVFWSLVSTLSGSLIGSWVSRQLVDLRASGTPVGLLVFRSLVCSLVYYNLLVHWFLEH